MAAPESKWSHRRGREYDVAQDIGYALTQTTRAYQQALNAEVASYGVTIRQSQVLGWVLSTTQERIDAWRPSKSTTAFTALSSAMRDKSSAAP